MTSQVCQLCSESDLASGQSIHTSCATLESHPERIYQEYATQTCNLCGKPSAASERGVHLDCALYEEFLASH